MSEKSPLRILTFGVSESTARGVNDRLRSRGIDAESHVVSNTPTSDAEIANILTSKHWDGFLVGYGVRIEPEWFERLQQVAKNANPDVPLINHKTIDDLENSIEHHFNIQLPPATA
ncbi:unnamed protein product [Adineta steineri]|uniref:Uncharacterized protein n=1 Tax=Adineta steineri TaxID=433720 RepID=A0A819YUG7_9BILA|nr:unnamed protein product [Adineta steineri]CAF4163507.1 unnamed protein product [Adineta steineri]